MLKNDYSTFRNGNHDKIPMKFLNKGPELKQSQLIHSEPSDSLNLDLNYLLKPLSNQNNHHEENLPSQDTNDDFLVDISDEKMLDVQKTPEVDSSKVSQQERNQKTDIKLNDIFVKLENIKPSNHPPLLMLAEKNRISASVHLAKDKPKDGVCVYVITTVSKNELPLSNYLFQAVVPKVIKFQVENDVSLSLM